MLRPGLSLLLAGGLLMATGCQALRVREEEKPVAETVLMVARGANETVLSWNTTPGAQYLVLFADRRDGKARWQPLPGASLVRGDGQPATFKDKVPGTQARFYRIEVIPPSGRRP